MDAARTPHRGDGLMPRYLALLIAALSLAFAPAPASKPAKKDQEKVTLESILKDYPRDEQAVERLFQHMLGRKPTTPELERVVEFLGKEKANRKKAFEDIEWALTNSKEYQAR